MSVIACFATLPSRRGQPVLIAASTLEGEDEPVLRAFARLRVAAPGVALILAPRHPERVGAVVALATRHGFSTVQRSELKIGSTTGPDVVVLDTVGELPRLFRLATLVFVGGSLVPAGGHNILEPAIFGKPVVFGPHMSNFAEIAAQFLEKAAAIQVTSPHDLEGTLVRLLADPVEQASLGAAARALVEANRGARARHLSVLAEVLPPDGSGAIADVRDFRASREATLCAEPPVWSPCRSSPTVVRLAFRPATEARAAGDQRGRAGRWRQRKDTRRGSRQPNPCLDG